MSGYEAVELELSIGHRPVRLSLRLPEGPMTLHDFLPVVQALDGLTLEIASRDAAELGRRVRCGPGCGACCRQPVPIAPAEALALRRTVANLPPDRRERVMSRFAQAIETLAASGLLARFDPRAKTHNNPDARIPDGFASAEARRALGLEYFALGIPCPFLEGESCSIHPERPLACREYLVVSDPIACAQPSATAVAVMALPLRLSVLFARLVAERVPGQPLWIPLILALEEGTFDTAAMAAPGLCGAGIFDRLVDLLASAPAAPNASGS